MYFQDLAHELTFSLQAIGGGTLSVIPKILGAFFVLLIGLVVASVLDKTVRRLVNMVKLNDLLTKAGVAQFFTRAGLSFDIGVFLGGLVRLFVLVVFLVASIDILGLVKVNEFLGSVVLGYLPQVFVAVFVLLFAALVSDFIAGIVTHGTQALGLKASRFLGGVVKVSMWAFAIIVALSYLGIGAQYLYTLFTGFVVMIALAGGLAFGLGGKDAAGDLIHSIRTELRKDMKHPHDPSDSHTS